MTHSHSHGRAAQKRALWIALVANAGFMLVEFIGGIVFNSVALLADAVHMLSDVAGLVIALAAQGLMNRPASTRHTFGLQRAEVLGALMNGVTLLAAVIWIVIEAVGRFSDPEPVAGVGLVVVASLGLAVNIGSAIVLSRSKGESLNMQGAFIHMASDAAGSVAVLIAAASVILWGATWADPLASLLIAGLILWATWGLLRDAVHVLMEGAPRGMDVAAIEKALAASDGVESVHHLHLWNLASDVPALSAHVVLAEERSLHDAQQEGNRLREMLGERFGVQHATLELECHPCAEVEERPEVEHGESRP